MKTIGRLLLAIAIACAVLTAAISILATKASAAPAEGVVVCDHLGCSDRPHAGLAVTARHAEAHRRHVHAYRARKTHQRPSLADSAFAAVRSRAGAVAYVLRAQVARFQGYVRALEARGATIFYMGGIRRGRCSPAHQHPCGEALDVCQDARGKVSGLKDCHLPPPPEMAEIAEAHGLQEGSTWCRRPDYGHAQVIRTGSRCAARGLVGHGRRRYVAAGQNRMALAK